MASGTGGSAAAHSYRDIHLIAPCQRCQPCLRTRSKRLHNETGNRQGIARGVGILGGILVPSQRASGDLAGRRLISSAVPAVLLFPGKISLLAEWYLRDA